MNHDEVLKVYDRSYAEGYDQRFLLTPLRRPHTDFERETIGRLLHPGGTWLDVACGTGYFMQCFPTVKRTGLDWSPDMLRVAQERNPDATFRHASFLEPQPDWENHWDLVTCLGSAYTVVEKLTEIRSLIANLAAWTSPRGAVFLPVSLCDGLNGARIPYEKESPFPGRYLISAITWTFVEPTGEVHRDLIAPHEDWLVETFSSHFTTVERVVYPSLAENWEPLQRGIVASGKR